MSAIKPGEYFKIKRSTAEIKSELLNQYFKVWSENILKKQKNETAKELLFIDLFAGQGYEAETKWQAPFKFPTNESDNFEDLNKKVKIFLGETSPSKSDKLKANLEKLNYFEEDTRHPYLLSEVSSQELLIDLQANQAPALIYLESFSYSFAQQIIGKGLKNGNTDLFLLLNFNNLKSEILRPENDIYLIEFFGDHLPEIRNNLKQESSSRKKEILITDALELLFSNNEKYTFRFKINYPGKDQTSHYLMYAASTVDSYIAMKEFIQKYSDYQPDGVPTFTVNQRASQPLLPGFFTYLNKYNLEDLGQELAPQKSRFHYKTIQEVYEIHNIGTNYIKENYLQAFKTLKEAGRINLLDEINKPVKNITVNALVFYKLHGNAKV